MPDRLPVIRFLFLFSSVSHITHDAVVSAETSKQESSPKPICGRGIHHPSNDHQLLCIDDTNTGSDPATFSPWTHQPFCIESSESSWCVFTNADPRAPVFPGLSHHGISIVTTPKRAASEMSLLEHVTTKAPPILSPPSTYSETTKFTRPYKVVPIPAKGLGAIATERIPKGQLVLADRAMVISAAEYPDDMLREEVQDLLGKAVEQLPEPERVYELSRKGRMEEEGFLDVEDLLLSNSFLVDIAGEVCMVLFADLARFNHACDSNTLMHFSEKSLVMAVVATRNIEPEEEITISYIDAVLSYSERQETLHKIWGFNCTCSLCSASPKDREASDERRLEIQILREKVIRLAHRGDFPDAIETSEKLFSVIGKEGLESSLTDMYDVPARLYYHVGNLEKAREYTVRSLQAVEGFKVPGSKEELKIEMLRSVLDRIESEMTSEREA